MSAAQCRLLGLCAEGDLGGRFEARGSYAMERAVFDVITQLQTYDFLIQDFGQLPAQLL
jgi:hypothetical protein